MKTWGLLTIGMLISTASGWAADGWSVSYKENGGGFHLDSPDGNYKFALLGYAQAEQNWYLSSSYGNPGGPGDYPLGFQVTRARLDFSATMFKDYDLFIETDAAPTIPANIGGPGLVLAQITAKLLSDQLMLRLGKFVVPFSTEGYRSSRDFDTINRNMALNTLYFIPSQDVQYGAMLFGKLLEGKLGWFASVVNGNAAVSINQGANSVFKEYDAKLTYDFSSDLKFGLAGQFARTVPGPLGLYDLTYTAYNTIPMVTGNRFGFTPDLYFAMDKLSLRAELIYMKWPDSPGTPTLSGGFAQVAYFVTGDKTGGFQPLVRAEYNKLTGPLATAGADHLTALLAGWQWYINSNLRHQLNFISTIPSGATGGAYANNSTNYAVLSELQLKF